LYQSQATGGGNIFFKESLDKAVRLAGLVSEGEKEMIHFAKAYQDGNKSKMEKHRDELLLLYPRDERVLTWVGWSYYINKDYDEAINHFRAATRLNENFHPAYSMLGQSLVAKGDIEEAEKAFKKYIELLPENVNSYVTYAELLQDQGRFDEAIKPYKKALELDDKFITIHKDLGDIALFKGDNDAARQHYRDLYLNASTSGIKFWALLLEASVYLHQNDTEGALKVMDKYSNLAEEMNLPYNQFYGIAYKGYILTENGQIEEGIKHYRNAKEMIEQADLFPKVRENLTTLSNLWEFNALALKKDIPEAEAAQKRCKSLIAKMENPRYWSRYNRASGILEMNKGRYNKASKYLAKSGDDPMVWYYTGLSHQQSGNPKKAREWYEKVAKYYNNSFDLGNVRNKALAGLSE
jgi:tetratricopeptide (TPR) repeat protein